MPFLDKPQLQKLYSSGLSIMEISEKHKVSIHKVAYWIKKYGISTRSMSDAIYLKHNQTGDPFKITSLDMPEKAELLALGIGLFLGEGTKAQQSSVRFANSDPQIVKLFLSFLRKICGVKEDKLRAWINLFDDRDKNECLDYWSNITGIPKDNFYSPVIRPRKTGTYKNRSDYGTITILVGNTKLLKQIKEWCRDYLNKYAEVAQW